MPSIYLSPSTQEKNQYVNGGTEEQQMNRLADAMTPYLLSSGIRFGRNTPAMTAASAAAASNRGRYDLHLALHSNASAPAQYGRAQGIIAFYYPGSARGGRAAEIFADDLRAVYTLAGAVRTQPNGSLTELRQTRAPAVLLELGFHDNLADADWIKGNTELIARILALALTEYFDIPFLRPAPARTGYVSVSRGSLNIRARPAGQAPVLLQAPKGAGLTVLNRWQDWYLVSYRGVTGYAARRYVTVG